MRKMTFAFAATCALAAAPARAQEACGPGSEELMICLPPPLVCEAPEKKPAPVLQSVMPEPGKKKVPAPRPWLCV